MLDIKLLPKQWEVFTPVQDVHYDITLYQGGFGSGKTHLGAIKGLSVLAANPGATWLVGADTMSRLDNTTWLTYEELLHDAKVRYKTNRSRHVITIPGWDNAKVMFKGVLDPMALRSVNGIGGHLEEASLIPVSSYLEFMGRLRQAKNNQIINLMLTTNPQASKDWLFEHFVKRGGITTEEIRGNEVRVSRRRVIARTLDNPHVSDAFIALLKASYDDEMWKMVVLGLDGDYTRGLVSHNFCDLNIIDTNYREGEDLFLTCDFNVDPMSWAVAHVLNRLDSQRREYHFIDELVIPNTNINECVDEFIRRYPNHTGNLIIGGDASGNGRNVQNDTVGGTSYTQILNRFKFHGYHQKANLRLDVREANPAIADRIAAWNAVMCNTNGVRRAFFNPRCKRLIENAQTLKYKEGTGQIDLPTQSQIKSDPSKKFLGHIFDAASYLVEKHDPILIKSYSQTQPPSTTVHTALSNLLRKR